MNNREKHEKAIRDTHNYLTKKYGDGIKLGNNPDWDIELHNGTKLKVFAAFSPTPRVKVQRGFMPDAETVYVFYRPAKNQLGFSLTAEHGRDVANAMLHFHENNGPSNIDLSRLKGRVLEKVLAEHIEKTDTSEISCENTIDNGETNTEHHDEPIEDILPSWRNRRPPRRPQKTTRPATIATLTRAELETIENEIERTYTDMLNRFDYEKYPNKPYERMIETFSTRALPNNEIENAMKWKWGHWKKRNYPKAHKQLIIRIERVWPEYVASGCKASKETFDFWKKALEKRQRYITIAFLTHLIHPNDAPIIDQHNYRAMNHLLSSIAGRNIEPKKKPSNWKDIVNMKIFLDALSRHLCKKQQALNRFLMVYGRYAAPG